VIAAGDAERQRLERDLHDGAQQRLVALSLSLSLPSTRRRAGSDAARLDEACAHLRAALGDLRELAAGIFPAVLPEEGLAAALEAFSEGSEATVRLGELTRERFAPDVEAAAYFVIAEAVRRGAGRSPIIVDAVRREGRLEVAVDGLGDLPDVVDLSDRVGALDGVLAHERPAPGRSTIRVVIPCAS
jgi:signal transduction histidine kinase